MVLYVLIFRFLNRWWEDKILNQKLSLNSYYADNACEVLNMANHEFCDY
jgi:hypothetical protein